MSSLDSGPSQTSVLDTPLPAAAKKAVLPDRGSVWSLYAGAVSEWTQMGVIGRLVLPVLTTGFSIRPEIVSWAMTIPRLLDAVMDPIIGHLSDHTRSRWGRRKPYVFAGSILSAISLILLWWVSPAWVDSMKFIYLLAVGTAFWMSFAVFSISLYGMNYELTDDYQFRVKFTAIRSIFCSMPGIVVGWAYWLALRPFFGSEITGIRCVSVALALLVLFTGLAPALLYKERFLPPAKKNAPGFWESLKQGWRIRPFRMIIILRLLIAFGWAIYSGLMFYINAFFACGGDKAMATKIAGITEGVNVILQILLVPLTPLISRHFDKRTLLYLGVGCHIMLAALGVVFFNPNYPYLQIAASLFWAPAGLLFGTFCGAALPDICDLDELENGTRREGLFGATLAFTNKVEVALCTLLVGYILVWTGFHTEAAVQTNATLQGLRLFAFAPYGIVSIIALVLALRYPITEKVMNDVRAKLEARRATSGTTK